MFVRACSAARGGALAFEVFEGAGDAFLERREGLPSQVDRGATRVEGTALHFPWAGWRVLCGLPEARELRHDVVELLHTRLDTGADVQQQAAALVDRTDERVDDI